MEFTSQDTLEVSIIMPCLNEAETLETCLEKAHNAICRHNLRAEIIVADNGSNDGSVQIATRFGARVVHVPVKGYGAALMAGIHAARGVYVIMGDADDSYDFGSIFPFIEKLREGYDLVMGCRFRRNGGVIKPGAMPWTHRCFGNPILSSLGRFFFNCPVSDFYCGLRAFRRKAFTALDLRAIGMEFAYEMIIKAKFQGYRITEIPITLYPDGRTRPPHLRTWQDGWRTLRFMLLYSPYWLFFVPGCALVILGLISTSILIAGPVRVGEIVFDTSTLLVCAISVLLGFKLIAFALFEKVFAISEGLLPQDSVLVRLSQTITLERGIITGSLLGVIGISLLGWGVLYWERRGFGPLSYPETLRLVIPAVTALTLGVEIVFSSFFLSILAVRRK